MGPLLLLVIGLGFTGAAAQATLTATNTFIPPSATNTEFVDLDCPEGTPAGWGTYTPEALWWIECEYCLWSETPAPTATITPTSTPPGTPGCEDIFVSEYGEYHAEEGGVWDLKPYTDWVPVGDWTDSGTSYYTFENDGEEISITFEGSIVEAYLVAKNYFGHAEVWLDGELVDEKDFYNPDPETGWFIKAYFPDFEEHTLELIPTGEMNPCATNDAIQVLQVNVYEQLPLVEVTCVSQEGGLICTQIDPYTVEFERELPDDYGTNKWGQFYLAETTELYSKFEDTTANWWVNNSVPGTAERRLTFGTQVLSHYDYVGGAPWTGAWETGTFYLTEPTYLVGAGTYYWQGYGGPGQSIGMSHANTVITISSIPLEFPGGTPTPTATPFYDTGYCASVVPFFESDFGFDLFISDGPANCNIGWDEFDVGDFEVPGVEICFQPVQVGVVTLFGQDYEMGVFLLAVGAAFLWRFVRTV